MIHQIHQNFIFSSITQKLILFLILIILLSACEHSPLQKSSNQSQPFFKKISLMTYNVENLFDSLHDPGTEDFSYLPLKNKNTHKQKQYCNSLYPSYKRTCFQLDWTENTVNEKMRRIAKIIKTSTPDGKGPDVVMLAEVENKRVLDMMNNKFLKESNYQTVVLIEGFDKRGIDLGLLSRLPLAGKPQLHKIPYKGKNKADQKRMNRSRGILNVPLKLPNKQKAIFLTLHLPSPRNPSYWRAQAIDFLVDLYKEFSSEALVFVGGDFNISKEEDNKHKDLFYKKLNSYWFVSHYNGACSKCLGTYNYKGRWSFLDSILFDRKMVRKDSPWKINIKSISVKNTDILQNTERFTPKKFNYPGTGISDHWPIYGEMILKVGS